MNLQHIIKLLFSLCIFLVTVKMQFDIVSLTQSFMGQGIATSLVQLQNRVRTTTRPKRFWDIIQLGLQMDTERAKSHTVMRVQKILKDQLQRSKKIRNLAVVC